jgi:hypothetical protein
MSEQNNFDEYLKQSFGDYTPDVPAHIWEHISAGKKKKRPAAFWFSKGKWMVLAAAVLITGGTAVWLFQKNNSNNISLENYNNSRQQGNEKAVPPVVVTNNIPGKNAPNQAESPVTSNAPDIGGAALDHSNSDVAITPGNDPLNKMPEGKIGKAGLDRDAPNTATTKNIHRKKEQKVRSKKAGFRTTAASIADEAAAAPTQDLLSTGDAAVYQQLLVIPGVKEKISLAAVAVLNNQQTVIKPVRIPDCPPAEKDAAGNKSYVELYAGPDYAVKKYAGGIDSSSLIEKRKESLRFQSAFSAGIRYTRVFANGMSIRAGINYSQINEKFSFIKDNVVQQVYVISPAGDTTDSYYVRGTRYKTSYNHYRTLDVPVVIGYELGNGRLHANINAGVMVNVYSWQKGETLDNNYQPVSITTGKEDNNLYGYKTNLGLGFTGAVSVYYKLNHRFHVMAEPYFRYNLSPMNNEGLSLQEKFTTMGMRLGVRLDLR